MKKYDIVTKGPVAKFYYKGSHSHPVRRTVLVIEENSRYLTGYEIREANEVRRVVKSPIKRYAKSKIPNYGDYCRLKMSKNNYNKLDNQSTLERYELDNLIFTGV